MHLLQISLALCIGCQAVPGKRIGDMSINSYGSSHRGLDNATVDTFRDRMENLRYLRTKQEKREYGQNNGQPEEDYVGHHRTPSVHQNNRYRKIKGTNTDRIIKQKVNGHRSRNGYYNRDEGNNNSEITQHLNRNFYNKDELSEPYKGSYKNIGNQRNKGYHLNVQNSRYGNNRQKLNHNLRKSRYQNKNQNNEYRYRGQQLNTNSRNNHLRKGYQSNGVYNGNQHVNHNLHRNRYRNSNRGNGRRTNRYQLDGNGRSKTFRNSRQQIGFQDIIKHVEGDKSTSEYQNKNHQNETGRHQTTNNNNKNSFENGITTAVDDSLNHQVSNDHLNNEYNSDGNGSDVAFRGSNDTNIDIYDNDDSSDVNFYGEPSEERVDFGYSRENGNHQQNQGSENNSHKPKLISTRDDYNKYNAKDGYMGAYRTSYTFYK